MITEWLRPEFKNRRDELVTRADFADRVSVLAQAISSRFINYADQAPKPVATEGHQKLFVATELAAFLESTSRRTKARTTVEKKRSELVRVNTTVAETEKRVANRRSELDKAERDLVKFQRQAKRLAEDLSFLESGEK